MAYINFDYSNNSIKVIRGLLKTEKDLMEGKTIDGSYSLITEDNFLRGFKLRDYLSDLELKGIRAENCFKELLERNSIPSLYVGQGPLGIEKSRVLKDKMASRRPDFLVNLPDMGVVFFDIKCRKKIGFPNSKNLFFQLFKGEIEGLIKLHENLLIPVWIAFIDESTIKGSEILEPEFYFIPISLLKKYYNKLVEELSERDKKMLVSIRVPDEILFLVKEKFELKFGVSESPEQLANNISKNYKGMFRRIEDKIRECIRNQKVLKTYLAKTIISETSKFAFKDEVEKIIRVLIDNGEIEYEPTKPLRLPGE